MELFRQQCLNSCNLESRHKNYLVFPTKLSITILYRVKKQDTVDLFLQESFECVILDKLDIFMPTLECSGFMFSLKWQIAG